MTNLVDAKKGLIVLHGRGATAKSILPLAAEFVDETFYVAAPQATGNSWYPHGFMEEEIQNEPWLSNSLSQIKRLVDEISQFVPSKNLYFMGFSQGACLALEFTARYAAAYGGVVAFTGGLIGRDLVEKKYRGNFDKTKIFIGNSDKDPHVPLKRSEESKKILEKLGASVTLKVYAGMGHQVNQDEIQTVQREIFKL